MTEDSSLNWQQDKSGWTEPVCEGAWSEGGDGWYAHVTVQRSPDSASFPETVTYRRNPAKCPYAVSTPLPFRPMYSRWRDAPTAVSLALTSKSTSSQRSRWGDASPL